MRKQKNEPIKISFNKVLIIFMVMLLATIVFLGVIYYINNKSKVSNIIEEIDYREQYGLKNIYTKKIRKNIVLSMLYSDELKINEEALFFIGHNNQEGYNDLMIYLYEIKYNFENYSIDKYANDIKKINSNTKDEYIYIGNEKYEICYIECIKNSEGSDSFYEFYYIIKYNDLVLTFYSYYEDKELYEKYNEIVTYIISNVGIIDNNDISKYKKIANQDSSYKRAYEGLNKSQKEKYNILYKEVLINKKKHYADIVYDSDDNSIVEYDIALEAIRRDMVYLGFEHYEIEDEYIWNEEAEKEIRVFYAKYDKNIYLPTIGLKYGMLYVEEIELTDKELKVFNKNVNNIINNLPDNLSTYGKYKYLAEAICGICEYDHEELEKKQPSDRIHSMIGVFVDGKAVCDGYAWAYYYLCNKIGLFCNYIDGNAANDSEPGHAFNYIKLGEKYYFVDVTWIDEGDNSFAFTYNSDTYNGHNEYVEDWFDVKCPKDSPFKELMDNLGTIDWYDIQNILN